MWVLLALFCETADLNKCQPATPPMVFSTEDACESFMVANIPTIDFNKVSVQYKCINFGDPA